MSNLRRRLSYANITATLALVFAMSGGALAATHYVITSTKQISPKVRKELKGNAGAKGATGATGAAGAPGAAGAAGAAGTALAYGTVTINGAGNPAFVNGSGFTGVTEPQANVYCITPFFTGVPIVAVPAGGGNRAVIVQVSPQQCPGAYEVEASASFAGGQGFTIVAP
jgi:hypothetical protein